MKPLLGGVALLLVIPVAALSAVAVARGEKAPLSSAEQIEPLLVPVTESTIQDLRDVAIKTTVAAGRPVSVQSQGLVTKLLSQPGSLVRPGDAVVSVEDLPVRAYTAPAPLWSDVTPASKGGLARRTYGVLASLGHPAGRPSDRVTPALRAAIRRYNVESGRKADGDTLRLSGLTWIGPAELRLASFRVAVGDSVSPGAVVAHGPGAPHAIAVSESSSGAPLPPGQYDLVVGTVRVPYEPGSGVVKGRGDVARLAAALGPQGQGAGTIVSRSPRSVRAVPATAVFTDASGATCIFTAADADTAVPVTALGSEGSTVYLPASTAATTVLSNPDAVLGQARCG